MMMNTLQGVLRHSKISGKTQNMWLFFSEVQHFNKSKIKMQGMQPDLSCVEYRRSVTYFAKNHYFFIVVEAFKIHGS